MTQDVTIRTYKTQDYLDIKSLLQEGELFDETLDSETHLARVIQKDPESILVAEFNGEIVGTISLNDGRMPMLFRLTVKKSFRRQGIGEKLLNFSTTILRQRGYEEVGFLVNDKKKELKSYYKNLGWLSGKNVFRWMYKKSP